MTPAQSKEIATLEEAIKTIEYLIPANDLLKPVVRAAKRHLAILKAEAAGEWKFVPTDGRQMKDCEPLMVEFDNSGKKYLLNQAWYRRIYSDMLSKAPAFEGGEI